MALIEKAAEKRSMLVRLIGIDIIMTAIVVVGGFMLITNMARLLNRTVEMLLGAGVADNKPLLIAALLNMALLMIGWRRYRDLSREVKQRAHAEDRANRLALRDPLTGLHNRRSLCEAGGDLLFRTRNAGKALAVVMIDLDHFKNVNDVHGHATGDSLLRTAASIIVETLPTNAYIARLGGDEFAAAIPYDEGQDGAIGLMIGDLVRRFSEPLKADNICVHAGASIGVARSSEDEITIEGMIRRADIAMYAAKSAGRNQMAWFDTSMEQQLQARNEIEVAMRAGLQRNEFIPYFERQIDMTSGRITGFEVLARWEHPSRGMVMPDEFISVAEETGMIGDISEMVARKALETARKWDPTITISINISPIQLRDPWLAQKIVKMLVETGFPPNRLEVEVTESALFENLALAQSIITSLKNQGIRIALDDFGTGYSSLAHLRVLPFDRIKIDKSFVVSILDNNESAAIVNAITSLGEKLNLTVTAEGIERHEIAERLAPMGIDKGQGWHFGQPMSMSDAQNLVAVQTRTDEAEAHVALKTVRPKLRSAA